jgi:acyl-CoA synthetase (AMP-forming)/AMP-acid ligase II
MKDLLHSFQGQTFAELHFETLEKSFFQSYENAIHRYAEKIFVKTYPITGPSIEKTYKEFEADVKKVMQLLLKNFSGYSILTTKAQNTYQHLVYICAILNSGFKFCPLNPNDSIQKQKQKLSQLGDSVYLFEDLEIPVDEVSTDLPRKSRDVNEAFIFVFTSGSTGHSKIVQQTEAGILCNVEALIRHHDIKNQRLTIATPLPLFHVNALEFSFFTSLLAGQKLVLYEKFDTLQILKSLQEDQVNILSVVPHLLFAIHQQISKLKKMNLDHFKYFVSAAAPLSLKTLKDFTENGFKVLQGYGLSEAVNFSLLTPIALSSEKILQLAERFKRPSAGIALWGNEVKVLGTDMKACEQENLGELAIRGPNIMLGYKNSQEPHGFDENYLLTGDRGFWFDDHETGLRFYFIVGRSKEIAKKYGSTVSLVELDEALVQFLLPEMTAISLAVENQRSGEEIAIAIKGAPKNFDFQNFFDQLKASLPAEMLAKVIFLTDDKLRTDSGKALRWVFKEPIQNFLDNQAIDRSVFILDRRSDNGKQ